MESFPAILILVSLFIIAGPFKAAPRLLGAVGTFSLIIARNPDVRLLFHGSGSTSLDCISQQLRGYTFRNSRRGKYCGFYIRKPRAPILRAEGKLQFVVTNFRVQRIGGIP